MPVDYLATQEIHDALLAHFGLRDDDALLERLGVDLRTIQPMYIGPDRGRGPDGSMLDLWGVGYSWVEYGTGRYCEATYLPFAAFRTLDDVEAYAWPSPDGYDYGSLVAQCTRHREYAIVLGNAGVMDVINGTARGRGVEQVLMDIATEDPVGLACMRKRHEFYLEWMSRCLDAVGDRIDVVFIGDDFGTQRAQLVSLDTFRRLFLPNVRDFAALARAYDIPLMVHSCGSNRLILPDLIDAGVTIYDTVQPEAAGMDPAQLKADFGDRMTWHGTISTQRTLPFGTAADVRAEVRQRIEVVGRDGGLIVAPAHNIQPDTPIENVLAMYDEAGSLRDA